MATMVKIKAKVNKAMDNIRQFNERITESTDAEVLKKHHSQHEKNFCIDFHGAAVIDEQGNEIAITEEMILAACQSLDDNGPISPYQPSPQD